MVVETLVKMDGLFLRVETPNATPLLLDASIMSKDLELWYFEKTFLDFAKVERLRKNRRT